MLYEQFMNTDSGKSGYEKGTVLTRNGSFFIKYYLEGRRADAANQLNYEKHKKMISICYDSTIKGKDEEKLWSLKTFFETNVNKV